MVKSKQLTILIAIIITIALIVVYRATKLRSVPDWAEGKTIAGTIGIMLCDYAEKKGRNGNYPPSWEDLIETDPYTTGTDDFFKNTISFKENDVYWDADYDANLSPPIRFLITVRLPENYPSRYKKITYDQDKVFKYYK